MPENITINAGFMMHQNIYNLKLYIMGNLLYLIAVIFVILWVIGFFFNGFGPNVGGLIHVLLVIAVIALLLKLIRRAA